MRSIISYTPIVANYWLATFIKMLSLLDDYDHEPLRIIHKKLTPNRFQSPLGVKNLF